MNKRARRHATWAGHLCEYCMAPACGVDHFFPVTTGGPDVEENWVAACTPCNNAKKNLAPAEWFAVMQVRGWV